MKIFISALAYDEGKSGISDYINSICKELSKTHHLVILINNYEAQFFPIKNSNVSFWLVSNWLRNAFLSMFWHLYILPFKLKNKGFDLFILPAGNRRLFARYPKNTIVTFHDLSQFHISKKYDMLRMLYIKNIIPHYLRKAPHIIVISENTKNDLIKYYHMPSQKLELNYNGYDPEKLMTSVTTDQIKKLYNIRKPYLLYISRIEHPGKNHLNLIKAFEILPDELKNEYCLVLAGSDWNNSEVVHNYSEKSIAKDNIIFTGFVATEYIGALYKGASLYVFPSLYEGFGIPMLEAMAMGIPVICSNRSSLPEIGGEAVLTFNPDIHADIADKIVKVLSDEKLRTEMIEKGFKRIKAFSWQKHIERLIATVSKE